MHTSPGDAGRAGGRARQQRTFVLIPGAGGTAWYWHRIVPLLRRAGHEAIAVDLPGDDPAAGLPEYTDQVVGAIGGRGDVVLVAQSLGGFTAPLVAAKVPVASLVFVNAMIPRPGETPGAWWGNTGWAGGPAGAPGRLPARRLSRPWTPVGPCPGVLPVASGPSKEAVLRVHEKAGHPTEEIYELPVEID